MLETRDFKNVEILATGTWEGLTGRHTFTDEELTEIVSAYEQGQKGNQNIPIKIGHNQKQKLIGDSMPSAGWVENIKKVGNKLVADFMKVPAKLAELIDTGTFRGRSVELGTDWEVGGKEYPLVLTAVALLGEALPAVESLADIVQLFEREGIETDNKQYYLSKEISLSEDEEFDLALIELDGWFSRIEKFYKTKPGAPTLRSLHRNFRDSLKRIHRGETKMTLKAETLKLLGLEEGATEEQIEAALATKFANPEAPKVEDTEVKAELAKASSEILELQKKIATNEANESVDAAIKDGRLLPVQRETALKMALRDKVEFEAFVKTQPSMLEFGERGTSADGNFAQFEPSQVEVDVAKKMGVWSPEHRINLMREKARAVGVEIPADYKAS